MIYVFNERGHEFDMSQWSSVIIRPSFWWRLKLLFKPRDLIFCWGQDRYMLEGFLGETYFAVGGVPTHMRQRANHGGCYRNDSPSKGER